MTRGIADGTRVALVFGGGVGLGAYQAGAYAALQEHAALQPAAISGSSIGAVNAAVIAGCAIDKRVQHLNDLWKLDSHFTPFPMPDAPPWQRWNHIRKWTSALTTRVMGATGHFHPRVQTRPWEDFASLYDLAPLRTRLERLVDFGRLNSGETRLSVATTDMRSGELVVFDTAQGDRIELDHIFASCGFLPEFAPLEIGGRMLGDGGLAANAPFEPLLTDRPDGPLICFILDLYAADGSLPKDLETAIARKSDLIFGNQTLRRLEAFRREEECRLEIGRAIDALPHEYRGLPAFTALEKQARRGSTTVAYLSYRPLPDEAGPERGFDYSHPSISQRWQAGADDMRHALSSLEQNGTGLKAQFALRRIRKPELDGSSAMARSETHVIQAAG